MHFEGFFELNWKVRKVSKNSESLLVVKEGSWDGSGMIWFGNNSVYICPQVPIQIDHNPILLCTLKPYTQHC